MDQHLALFLGVFAFLVLAQWVRSWRSRGKTKSDASDSSSTWTDNSIASEFHHSDASCHSGSADSGSSDSCSSDGGGSDGGGGGDSGSF